MSSHPHSGKALAAAPQPLNIEGQPRTSDSSSRSTITGTLPATPNQKRTKSMSFRSGQSGTVVRKGQMWHGRYYVDIPGEEKRRKASVPLGSTHTMKKPEAKRKLRTLLEEMGLNEDTHLERREAGARTFASEAAWWKENRLPIFKPSS